MDNEIENQINSLMHEEVQVDIVQVLTGMLDEHNIQVKAFSMARHRYREQPQLEFRLGLLSEGLTTVGNTIYLRLQK